MEADAPPRKIGSRSIVTFGIIAIFLCANSIAMAKGVPANLEKKVSAAYPNAKIVVEKKCRLGTKAIESYGILLQQPAENKSGPALEAMILYKMKEWKIYKINRGIEYSRGSDSDFLRDYRTPKGYAGGFMIRCTSPKKDKDINVRSNGEFGKFSAALNEKVQHLCFSASSTYNSWVCFTTDDTRSEPETSFVQLNAD
jgi:hypothetical protein